jgi:hypothetical protein
MSVFNRVLWKVRLTFFAEEKGSRYECLQSKTESFGGDSMVLYTVLSLVLSAVASLPFDL